MLPSTIAALRTQGIDTEALRRASLRHFASGRPFDAAAQASFWSELLTCRRAFRIATGAPPETVLAGGRDRDSAGAPRSAGEV